MQGGSLAGHLTALDWAIVAAVFALTSSVGFLFGKRATIRDFFLGGRKLPWWGVSISIVATEISALTLVSLPSVVFKPGGNFTYLQLALIGSVLARLAVAYWLVPAYYEREIYSPYEYMQSKRGGKAGAMATGFFALGGVLAQSARLYMTAVVLDVILHDELARLSVASGVPTLAIAVAAIGAFAVLWTWVGGISSVVWTDVVLFLVFVGAAIAALMSIASTLDTGFARIWQVGVDARKIRLFDFDASPTKAYTFWAAAIASSWGGIGAYGVDQTMAQRIFCCKSVRDARKAVALSSIAVLVGVIVAWIGVGLFAFYERHPLEGAALALYEKRADTILPIYIMQEIPAGWRGFVVAGILAAAISTLTGIIAALSQCAYASLYLPLRDRLRAGRSARAGGAGAAPERTAALAAPEVRDVRVSRAFVAAAGVVLCVAALGMERVAHRYGSILDLGLSMAGYTQGALIAGFALAFACTRVDGSGFLWSAPLSVLFVFAAAWHGSRSHAACTIGAGLYMTAWLVLRVVPDWTRGVARVRGLGQTGLLAAGLLFLIWINRFGLFAVEVNPRYDPEYRWLPIEFPWYVPIGSTVAFVFGVLLARPNADARAAAITRADAPSL